MYRMSLLVVAVVLGVAPAVSAQSAPALDAELEVELTAAFSALLAGQNAEAEAGFRAVEEKSPAGTFAHWLSGKLSALTRGLSEPVALDENPEARAQFERAFTLLLSQKHVEAQTLFLTGAILYPEGSSARQFGQGLSKVAEAATEFQPGAEPQPALTISNQENALPVDNLPIDKESSTAGGFAMVFNGALYGIFGGIISAVDLEVTDARAAVGLPLAGGILGGLGGYAYYKGLHDGKFSPAKAGPVTTGMFLGAGEAILITQLVDQFNNTEDTIFLGTTVGLGLGILASELGNPQKGDATLVFSSTLWATVLAGQTVFLVQPNGEGVSEAIITAGYNLGLLGSLLAAGDVDLSIRRTMIINGSGVLGTLAGVLTGLLILGDNVNDAGRFITASSMVGTLGGLTAGFLLTRNMDQPETQKAPALSFQGLMPGVAQGQTPQDNPLTFNALFTF